MKKKWGILLLSVFIIGALAGAGGCWFFSKRWAERIMDQGTTRFEFLTLNREADVYLHSLKAIDGGTNEIRKYQHVARSMLTGYLHEIDHLRSNADFELPTDFDTYKKVQEYLH